MDFGNLTTGREATRAVVQVQLEEHLVVEYGGFSPYNINTIYYNFTTGNAQDFGDLTSRRTFLQMASASNSTRGIFAGGYNPTPH